MHIGCALRKRVQTLECAQKMVYSLLNNIRSDIIGTQEGILQQIEDISDNLHLKYGYYGNSRLLGVVLVMN